ncbi:MAG: valine--tRNA ligase, partial [Betaproteobacteria bacterium]|nr:valine--tRNA ligase [Betaproteobacteria bacterium]
TLHFTGQVPFRHVYVHALVRDSEGQKMSKSKGNTLDPIDLIDGIDLDALVRKRTSGLMNPKQAAQIEKKTRAEFPQGITAFGTDALRFTFASLATPGRNINFDLSRCEGYRNFCNKLWNATRFVLMNCQKEDGSPQDCGLEACGSQPTGDNGCGPGGYLHFSQPDRWIVSLLQKTEAEMDRHLREYRFDLAAQAAYAFVWDQFCDWYVEFAKPVFAGADEVAKAETRATAAWTMEQILRMLQPFMPFVTAELFKDFGAQKFGTLMTCAWPDIQAPQGGQDVGLIIKLISAIRTVRSELNVPGSASIVLLVKDATPHQQKALHDYASFIQRLARVASIEFVAASVGQSAQDVVDGMTLMLPLADVIDLAAERTRLKKEEEKCKAEIDKINVKLSNSDFVAKAPPEVIDDH